MVEELPSGLPRTAAFRDPPRSGLKATKLRLLRAAFSSGLARTVSESSWRRQRLLILAYHGVATSDEHEWNPELFIPPDALRGRFELLRDGGYHVLPLSEALTRLYREDLPPRSVVLTFDDGMRDFATVAVPVLREFGFPATVYVTTYYSVKRVPVFRVACRYLLWRGLGRTIEGTGLVSGARPLNLNDPRSHDRVAGQIVDHCASLGGGIHRESECMRLLAERVGVDFQRFIDAQRLRIMTPEQIKLLPTDLVDVQLHTHRHRVPLNREPFLAEIEDNRRALSPLVSRPLNAFCYPSGVTNPRVLPWLLEAGIESATTCRPALSSPRSPRLLLPRLVDTWSLTRLEFEGWLTGVAAAIPRLPGTEAHRPAPVYD